MHDLESSSVKALVNIVVAHLPEAKPLLRQFALSQIARTPHPLFANNKGIYLTVSGNGGQAMAMACAHLAGRQQAQGVAPAWLNVGIAGHGSAAIGSGILINRILDGQHGNCYFPSPVLDGFPVSSLQTVNRIERRYAEPQAYDMEGAAFWVAATQYAALDLVQLYKIVSDNPQQHVDDFQIESVPELFSARQEELAAAIEQLCQLASEQRQLYDLPVEYYQLVDSVTFSATQRSQLQKMFHKWSAFGQRELLLDEVASYMNNGLSSKQILSLLAEAARRFEPLAKT